MAGKITDSSAFRCQSKGLVESIRNLKSMRDVIEKYMRALVTWKLGQFKRNAVVRLEVQKRPSLSLMSFTRDV